MNDDKKVVDTSAVEYVNAAVTTLLGEFQSAVDKITKTVLANPAVATARGTGDHDEIAKEAVRRTRRSSASSSQTIKDKVEHTLRNESLNMTGISRAVGASVGRISEVMKALRAEGKLSNVGTDVNPVWTLKIGNNTSTPDLTEFVFRLLSERPFTIQELSEVTGATYSRVGGVVVTMARDPQVRIEKRKIPHTKAFRYFIKDESWYDAVLEPKKPKIQEEEQPKEEEAEAEISNETLD